MRELLKVWAVCFAAIVAALAIGTGLVWAVAALPPLASAGLMALVISGLIAVLVVC